MKRKLYVAVWGMSLLAACSAPKTGAPEWFENAVKTSDHQLLYMAEQLKDVPDTACFPRSTKADGSTVWKMPKTGQVVFIPVPCGWPMR